MSGQYFVKSVLSADTLVLLVPNKMPPVEKTVSLAHLNCPRLANKQKASTDEPYAWEARDKVRKQLIGQTVEFHHEYSKEDIKREFGRVSFKGTDVAKVLVSEGLAEVRPYQNKKSEYTDALQKAYDEAKAAKKGKHSDDPSINHIRDITWETEISENQVLKWKGQTKKAIVEAVLNPRLLKVLIVPSHEQVSLALSGIAQQPQFAAEAKFFIERAILNREVSVLFEGVDKGGANRAPSSDVLALGSIVSGGKCFQNELVSKGLVTINNFTIAECQHRQQLRDAEAAAKAARLKYWSTVEIKEKSEDPKRPEATIGGEGFRGTLVQANSGDTITIAVGGQLRKVQLANTRAAKPLFDDEGENGQRSIVYPRYALEAREFVRSRLIGKEIDVKIEYSRPIPIDDTGDKKEERTFVTIFIDGKPIQALMAREGLVSYVRGPPGTNADDMVVAEQEAKEKKRGIWSKELEGSSEEKLSAKTAHKEKRPGTTILKDLFRPGQKVARQYITFLAKGGSKLRGVVEQVVNPARVRVLIVNQNLIITLALAGLTAPSSGGKKAEDGTIEAAEPFGEEALDFARRNFWQRDVEIEVENHDPNGTFFGSAFIGGQNIACLLLERGYANLNNAAQTTKHAVALKGAAKTAAEKKVGIWSLDESQRPQPRGQKNRKPKWGAKDEFAVSTGPSTTATVTNVDDLTWFHAQTTDKERQLPQVSEFLGQVDTSDSKATQAALKNGDIVAARFSSDKQLYRAKVLGVKDKTVHVSYFDWGNSEKLNRDQIWVSQKIQESYGKIPPLASGFGVAFVKPASDEDVADEAGSVVQKLYKGPITLRPAYTVGDKQYVSVALADGTNFQETLLKGGYARLQARFRAGGSSAGQFSDDLKALQQAEEAARRAHKGIWRYGDAVSDDEE